MAASSVTKLPSAEEKMNEILENLDLEIEALERHGYQFPALYAAVKYLVRAQCITENYLLDRTPR